MLNEKEQAKLAGYFESVAVAQGKEVEEVQEIFNECLETIELAPSMAGKSHRVLIKRAKSAMSAIFDNMTQPGDNYIIVPFGPLGDPRDWNRDFFSACDAEVERGNIKGLIAEGKLMTMEVNGKTVPVSEITSYETEKKYIDPQADKVYDENGDGRDEIGVHVVTDGVPWTKGRPLIYRDSIVSSRGRTNWGYGKPLRHRWAMQLVGMGYPEDNKDDVRLIEINVKYDQADVNDKAFLLRHMDMFKSYRVTLEINTKKTTAWRYSLDAKRINFIAAEVNGMEDVDAVIEDLFEYLKDEYSDEVANTKMGKGTDELPDFLDGFSQLKEYHTGTVDGEPSEFFIGAVRRKADGSVQKSPSNWDSMKWNKYAIMVCNISGIKEPSRPGGSWTYFLSDSTMPNRMAAWSSNYIYNQPKIPGPCIMMVKSNRSPTRYDRATKMRVPDIDNGDISLTVLTVSELETTDELEFGE